MVNLKNKFEIIGNIRRDCNRCKKVDDLTCIIDYKTKESKSYCSNCIKKIYDVEIGKKKVNKISELEGIALIEDPKQKESRRKF